ncbi:shikimate kinase [Zobellia nedashkovskayae]
MSRKDKFTVVLVGVCGTGKSVVGEKVAKKLDIPFFDADALFSEQLVADKENTNTESNTWLSAITSLVSEQNTKDGCVVSCSILKKEQRLQLAKNLDLNIDWVFMNGTYDEVNQRIDKGHAKHQTESSLESDFELLEIPKRALTIDITHSEQDIVDTILKYLARKYG